MISEYVTIIVLGSIVVFGVGCIAALVERYSNSYEEETLRLARKEEEEERLVRVSIREENRSNR